MAYTPPNVFANGNEFTAGDVKENDDALRIYLHEGVVAGDLLNSSAWVQTRHVQAPVLDAITGVQHGVTGYQGSQWDGGALVRCQFGSAFLTGKRYGNTADSSFEVVPQTTFGVDLRRTATVIFHWWMESLNGPDDGPRSLGANAYMWVTEYTTTDGTGVGIKNVVQSYAEEAQNAQTFQANNPPGGPAVPYSIRGYGNMSGVKVFTATNKLAVGLAHLSTIDRSAIINWGVSLEVYYL